MNGAPLLYCHLFVIKGLILARRCSADSHSEVLIRVAHVEGLTSLYFNIDEDPINSFH